MSSSPSWLDRSKLLVCSLFLMNDGQIEEFDKVEEAFKLMDLDKDGFITKTELRQMMSKFGEILTDEELNAMIDEADTNKDGKVDINEFRALMETE